MANANEASPIQGWDIGGVNLKAVRLAGESLITAKNSFYIWQQPAALVEQLTQLAGQVGPAPWAAVAITAELSDAFRTKREGIAFVIDALQTALPETELRIFGVDGQFHRPAPAKADPLVVAAANWRATAQLVARRYQAGLLVDIGSTTTDLIPFRAGQVTAQGRTDPERLLAGELLYTGALRTPIHAIVQRVPLWGGWCPVAAEQFATSQDVHLLLGHLSVEQCTSPSADGRPVTAEFGTERLARLVCADVDMLSREEIMGLARHLAAEQVAQISRAMGQLVSRAGVAGPVVPVGVGTFLAEAAAARLGLAIHVPEELLDQAASEVAPAVAVARLLRERLGRV